MRSPQECAATGRGCGTPSGWRNGGRCPRCRAAHNDDTNRYRGAGTLTDAERGIVLRALRDGDTAEGAAALIGRTAAGLASRARSDSELRLALDGAPARTQRVARMGDYLAALTRHHGIVQRAAKELGVTSRLVGWRSDPAFAAAEAAVRELARTADAIPRQRITVEMLDRAAEALERGASMREAARLIAVSATSLRNGADRSPRLAAALPPLTTRKGSPRGRRKGGSDADTRLREMWGDPSLTIRDIGRQLHVTPETVRRWAAKLELPLREGTAFRHRYQRDQHVHIRSSQAT